MTEKITNRLLDKFGNNAVLACPACEKPYLTTGILKKGRPCPHCGKSRAFIAMNGDDPHVVMEPSARG
jgi:uncharacterized protein (DUF983 family)